MGIIRGPDSSQLEGSHLMSGPNVVVTLPKNGRCAHPAQRSLSLDARGKTQLAYRRSLDAEEHRGSFCSGLLTRPPFPQMPTWPWRQSPLNTNAKCTCQVLKRARWMQCNRSLKRCLRFLYRAASSATKKHTQLLVYEQSKKE